eukprot:jgi/Tetstr1/441443/TSEL_029689.t1
MGWGAVGDLSDVDMGPGPRRAAAATSALLGVALPLIRRSAHDRTRALMGRRAHQTLYAGHARQRRTDADLFAALLVGTADTVVALVEDKELSRAAGRLSFKGMGDLSNHAILTQLRDTHSSRGHPILDAAYDFPVDEATP